MKQERERAREEAAQEKARYVCALLLICGSSGAGPCRERERRLEARNTALQLSTEQLEKKIQTKVLSHVTYTYRL